MLNWFKTTKEEEGEGERGKGKGSSWKLVSVTKSIKEKKPKKKKRKENSLICFKVEQAKKEERKRIDGGGAAHVLHIKSKSTTKQLIGK